MLILAPPPQPIPSKLTASKREAVFRKYGRRCHYPDCTLDINDHNYLCVHDITDTGQHTNLAHLRPLCMIHHNQATMDARSAKPKIARLRAQGITINETQSLLFEQAFYGHA